jgi:hypothetical protein
MIYYSQDRFDRTILHLGQIDKTTSPLTIISGSSIELHFGQLQIVESIFSPLVGSFQIKSFRMPS